MSLRSIVAPLVGTVVGMGLVSTSRWVQGAEMAASSPTATSTVPAAAASKTPASPLTALERRYVELVGRIAEAEAKVEVIKSAALGGAIEKGKTVIIHRNDVGAGLVLEHATYAIDGATVFDESADAGGLGAESFEIFNGPLEPGRHDISVSLRYQGSSGIFSYLEGYKFKVDSRYALVVQEGKLNQLEITTHAKNDMTKEFKDRLAVKYDLTVGSISERSSSSEDASPMVVPDDGEPGRPATKAAP